MKKLVFSSALGLFVLAPVAVAATAHAEAPFDGGSSSTEVLCSPIGSTLVVLGSAENPHGPVLPLICGLD